VYVKPILGGRRALTCLTRVAATPGPLFTQAVDHVRWAVTAEGREYVHGGTPEARVWEAAGGEGVPLADLKARDT
jgi:hypothetical protein